MIRFSCLPHACPKDTIFWKIALKRREPILRVLTILRSTDFSEIADQALQMAHTLARDHKAKLILVTAAAPPSPPAIPRVRCLRFVVRKI